MNKNLIENAENRILNYLEFIEAHDAVHPDRNVCGGVGGCRLLHGEVRVGEELFDMFRSLSETAENFTLNIVRR